MVKQVKRDKLELLKWQEILDGKKDKSELLRQQEIFHEKNIEKQVKRDKLDYLGDRKYSMKKINKNKLKRIN